LDGGWLFAQAGPAGVARLDQRAFPIITYPAPVLFLVTNCGRHATRITPHARALYRKIGQDSMSFLDND
jgi:hypothetical protein